MPMKDATKPRVNLGITLAGLGLAAATTAATATGPGLAIPIITGLVTYLFGVAGNQTAKWFGDHLDALPTDQQDIFRNHHLRTVITDAAVTVVEKVLADRHAPTGTLQAARKHIAAALAAALDDPKSPLAALSEFNLPDLLTRFTRQKGRVETLTVAVWTQFLDTLPAKLWPNERDELAAALHARFAEALWGRVKEDAAQDGQAAAALQVLYLSRILAATEGTARREDTAPIARRIAQLVKKLDARATAHFRHLFAQNKSLRAALDAHARTLGDKVDAVGGKVDRLHQKLDTVLATAPLQAYYTELREHFSSYDNVGLPINAREGDEEKDQVITIRQLFVAPHCANTRVRPAELDAALAEGKKLGRPFLPMLQPPRQRIVLLADPGMGKSTVIQWLIATLAEGKAPEGAPELQGVIPLPFVLRELHPLLPADVRDWNWDALLKAFREWNPRGSACTAMAAALVADEALFRTVLADARAFFLIDGLDEIGDPARRTAMRDAIHEGFKRHSEARFLVTSRVVGYEVAEVHAERRVFDTENEVQALVDRRMETDGIALSEHRRFTKGGEPRHEMTLKMTIKVAALLYLAPFDNDQQDTFARNWYLPRMARPKGERRAGEFTAAVRSHPHTRVIGRVPNLLYLLALLYRHRATLPHGRALVYRAISEAYLETIPVKRKLPHAAAVSYTLLEKERFLALVGMGMQRLRAAQKKDDGDAIHVSREQLGQWLQPVLPETKARDAFLDHIAHSSGLLLPRGEDAFAFAHLSFQEFYAALHLQGDFERLGEALLSGETVPKKDRQLFQRLAAQPVWHEPLLFLVERLRESAPYTKRLLKWMFPQLEAGDPAKGMEWMPFPAAQLLATLSIDPQVALDPAQRTNIWRKLWQAHIAAWNGGWNIAEALVVAGSAYQTLVLQAAVSLQPTKFHLAGCTGVNDLKPLAGLGALQMLNLTFCTGVSDLKPLAGLGGLQILRLTGCPRVSDKAMAALQASLPKLKIHR